MLNIVFWKDLAGIINSALSGIYQNIDIEEMGVVFFFNFFSSKKVIQ